jgi:hypothetical protein
MEAAVLGERQGAAIDLLDATPRVLRALLAGLSSERLEVPADEDWSPHDVVSHFLITQRIGALDRIRSMIEQEYPLLMNRDENEELRRSGYESRAVPDLLEEFSRRREADTAWLRTLEAQDLQRSGDHSVAGHVTAEEMLYHAAHHDTVHLAQLTTMLGAYFEPHRGPMRVF